MNKNERIPSVLVIGGADTSAAAGIQADLKTLAAHGVYGASVITALTAQNTRGVAGIHFPPAEFIAEQINAVLGDLDVRVVKIGMLGQAEIIDVVSQSLNRFDGPVILDPVMVSSTGRDLLQEGAEPALRSLIEANVTLLTPNLAEAAKFLACRQAENEPDMVRQMPELLKLGASAVLLKGGHAEGSKAVDYLLEDGGEPVRFEEVRVDTPNNRGTGCTLASAIAANLTKGYRMNEAVAEAKAYLTKALEASKGMSIGEQAGPVHHFHEF